MGQSNRSTSVALVTGSSSGIGAAIAQRLASDGWTVIGVDISSDGTASYLSERITADLSNLDQVRDVLARVKGVQALVHAAGFMRVGGLVELDPADGDALWAVHVRALTVLAQGLCPQMSAGGRLLAIGSRTSAGAAQRSQYAAVKAAVTALVRSWAIELAPRGITANVIAPAATATAMLTAGERADVAPVVPPIGRLIEPREIAAYAAFILSSDAAAITGQHLLICGGASL
jgi:3-oxoacyl-[acyl-carrier protein] reductase